METAGSGAGGGAGASSVGAEAVGHPRQRRSSSAETLRVLLKIIVIGDVGVGKTSLLEQFVNNRYTGHYKSTIGADFLSSEVTIQDKVVTLQLWDTAGQERFHTLGVSFYRGANACILVFDKTRPETFTVLDNWREEFLAQCAPTQPESFPFIVMGNMCDKVKASKVSKGVASRWCAERGFPYFETSARENINVRHAFMEAAERALARKPIETSIPFDMSESIDLNLPEETATSNSKCCLNL